MPKILIIRNLVFLIFGVDIWENRRHIHIVKKSVQRFKPAKFWMSPEILVSEKGDFTEIEIRKIEYLITEYQDLINLQLDDFLAGKKVRIVKINK